MQTENRRTCSYAEVQPIFAIFRLQNNKKRRKKQLGEARKQVAEGATLKLVKEKSKKNGSNRDDLSQKRVLFLFAEGEPLAECAQIAGRNVEERGDVLQREHLHHLRTAFEQTAVAAAGGVAVVVEVAAIDHLEQVLQDLHVHLRHLRVVVEQRLQLLSADDAHLARHVRLDAHLRHVAVKAIGEVGHELALEGEPRAVVLALLVVVNHVLEAAPLHEGHPLRRLARLLQRLAPLERPPLPVLHAVLPQKLQVQPLLVGVELLVLIHLINCLT